MAERRPDNRPEGERPRSRPGLGGPAGGRNDPVPPRGGPAGGRFGGGGADRAGGPAGGRFGGGDPPVAGSPDPEEELLVGADAAERLELEALRDLLMSGPDAEVRRPASGADPDPDDPARLDPPTEPGPRAGRRSAGASGGYRAEGPDPDWDFFEAAGGAAGEGRRPRSLPDPSNLLVVLDGLRGAVPRELQDQLNWLVRELLLAVRALIDWYLERLERRRPEARVEDIPID